MACQRSTVQWWMQNAAISQHSVRSVKPLLFPHQLSSLSSTTVFPLHLMTSVFIHRSALVPPSTIDISPSSCHLRFCHEPFTACRSAGDTRRHHLCSRAAFAFITILLALPPPLRGQCSLSLSGEVLPKIVGISISTKIDMKHNNQLQTKRQ